MPIPIWLIKPIRNKIIRNTFAPTDLNAGENDTIEELKNPNSPMYKDVSEWSDWDKTRAINSPSYQSNYYLQNQVRQYNKNLIDKYLQNTQYINSINRKW
jgi:hypothetical protein